MKKKILLLIISPIIYSCIPQTSPIKLNSTVTLKFGQLPEGIDKAEITIKNFNCENVTTCETKSLTINKGIIVNTQQVTTGNKVVTIKIYKDGNIIDELIQNINIQLNQNDLIIIPSVIPKPIVTENPNNTLIPSNNPTTLVTPTPSSIQIIVTPIPTSTPSGTTILTGSNGGTSGGVSAGSGNGGLQAPIIEVSATVKPRNTGIK